MLSAKPGTNNKLRALYYLRAVPTSFVDSDQGHQDNIFDRLEGIIERRAAEEMSFRTTSVLKPVGENVYIAGFLLPRSGP